MSWLRGVGLVVAAALVASFLSDFVGFARGIENAMPPQPVPDADAIVALTGGTRERLTTGMRLLEEGRGRRLLVSGVNTAARDEAVYGLLGGSRDLIACCVDLGRRARTTLGNASETASWAQRNGFARIIVVTDDYHMPRSLAELHAAMPATRLIAYPVPTPQSKHGAWRQDVRVAASLCGEYVKYLIIRARVAMLRTQPAPAPAPQS